METKRMAKTKGIILQEECHHHWIIGMAKGPLSAGSCTICGMQREFKNYPSDHLSVDDEFRRWIGKEKVSKEESNAGEDYALPLSGKGL